MTTRAIRFLVLAIVLFAPAMFSFQAAAQTVSSMKGRWILTTVRDGQRREITFDNNNGQLTGNYISNDKKPYAISAAKLVRGSLSFKVSDLGLYFELRYVGTRFDGRMFASNKKTPELVQLTKQ